MPIFSVISQTHHLQRLMAIGKLGLIQRICRRRKVEGTKVLRRAVYRAILIHFESNDWQAYSQAVNHQLTPWLIS
jgi:hypothetical protein